MSDRLNELRRQRAQIQEHLAWLDRQIAVEGGNPSVPTAPSPATSGAPVSGAVARISGSPFAAADRIIAQYQMQPEVTKNDVRKGCLLYFALAFLAVGLGVVALYLYSSSKN